MALANELQSLIDKSQRELDIVAEAQASLSSLDCRMEGLFHDIDTHKQRRSALAYRLLELAHVPAQLPPPLPAAPGAIPRIAAQIIDEMAA